MGRHVLAVSSVSVGVALALGAPFGCRSPTQIMLQLSTDIPCSEFNGYDLYAGAPGTLDGANAPTVLREDSSVCSGLERMKSLGSFVLAPAGTDDAAVEIKIIAAVRPQTPDGCALRLQTGCLLSTYTLAFSPHTPLTFPITIEKDCLNLFDCGANATCIDGTCKNNQISCTPGCAAMDAGVGFGFDGGEGGEDGAGDAGPTATSFHDPFNWSEASLFSFSSILANGYSGGTFDGRYVYLAPRSGPFVRFDTSIETSSAFQDGASWSTYTAPGSTGQYSFAGAVYAGGYVYYVPENDTTPIARYDTTKPFSLPSSWELAGTGTGLAFAGGAETNGYLYLAGLADKLGRIGSGAPFGVGPPVTFNAAALKAGGFLGAIAGDMGHVFFLPSTGSAGRANGTMLRYDTTIPQFADAASGAWATIATPIIDGGAGLYRGGAYDGRYLYLAPGLGGTVARYETTSSLGGTTAWESFDTLEITMGVGGAFFGAAFDGTYVYFAPNTELSSLPNARPVVVRYGTKGKFSASTSWEAYAGPAGAADATASQYQFAGAVFDGQYVYFVPYGTGEVVRFRAWTGKVKGGVASFY